MSSPCGSRAVEGKPGVAGMKTPEILKFIKDNVPQNLKNEFMRMQKKDRKSLCDFLSKFEAGRKLLPAKTKTKTNTNNKNVLPANVFGENIPTRPPLEPLFTMNIGKDPLGENIRVTGKLKAEVEKELRKLKREGKTIRKPDVFKTLAKTPRELKKPVTKKTVKIQEFPKFVEFPGVPRSPVTMAPPRAGAVPVYRLPGPTPMMSANDAAIRELAKEVTGSRRRILERLMAREPRRPFEVARRPLNFNNSFNMNMNNNNDNNQPSPNRYNRVATILAGMNKQ